MTELTQKFSFFKGGQDFVAPREDEAFDWDAAASKAREQLGAALNARNVSFLLGSGCSSYYKGDNQVGIPTMAPMAKTFLANLPETVKGEENPFITKQENDLLSSGLGIDVTADEYQSNLERLMEVLFSAKFALDHGKGEELKTLRETVTRVINKVKKHVLTSCSEGEFSSGDDAVVKLYQAFYQKLVFRDRSLPRPWVFTTNYDLFNETAMDRLGIPYCNGFSGAIERRFNPSVYRYSLAEQLDISSRKWTAVDNFVYLCKLHGSVSWIEDDQTLFPIRELQQKSASGNDSILIYPTPVKQNASFGSPYADLFREFQKQIVHDQSVLFTIGYSFGDEHINNIIFQALTVPNFRLIAFLPPNSAGVPQKLIELKDPRIWILGGDGPSPDRKAHYFDTFVERFMPASDDNKIDNAVANALNNLIKKPFSKNLVENDNGNG